MTILIIHYHLRAGGVTRVIHSQIAALKMLGHRVVVASSGPVDGLDAESVIEPTLDYQREGDVQSDSLFTINADLWIIHNPTLGKNAGFPALIEQAANSCVKILLQCHDFAEDGRPGNYALFDQTERLYPLARHVHYALINRRDQEYLSLAGIPTDRCHYLPNAVIPPTMIPGDSEGILVFYPVRGIRRKNLGELCLLAAHAPPGVKFAVALAPENAEWIEIHNQWQEFAGELGLPIEFDVVSQTDFATWLGRATHLVTTSVAEGFGLTFLEPAFLKKPLIGRNLPEVTTDFSPYGTLYEEIPVTCLNLEHKFKTSLARNSETYGKPLDHEELERVWQSFSKKLDFGNLPECEQRRIIRDEQLPWLREWLEDALLREAIEIDLSPWSLENYAAKLHDIVSAIESPEPVSWLAKEQVLEQFLSPSRFHFLRT